VISDITMEGKRTVLVILGTLTGTVNGEGVLVVNTLFTVAVGNVLVKIDSDGILVISTIVTGNIVVVVELVITDVPATIVLTSGSVSEGITG